MKILQKLSQPGSHTNEDLILTGPHYAAVLDGATSLVPSQRNAVWFVETFQLYFSALMEDGADLCKAINDSILAIRSDLPDTIPVSNSTAQPSAAAAFAFREGDNLHILCLGDCVARVFRKNAPPEDVFTQDLSRLDRQVIQKMIEIRAQTGGDMADIVKLPVIRDLLITNRKTMNQVDGYRVLAANMSPCSSDDLVTYNCAEVSHILLFSDGFEHVSHLLVSPEVSLEDIYAHLRKDELEDKTLNTYPRFKIHDDASAILLEL